MDDVAKVGFIGLGSMGRRMAANVARQGFELVAYDIDADARAAAAGPGVTMAENVTTVGRDCNHVILSLPDGEIVTRVLFGDPGLATALPDQAIVVDCSTTHPETARELAARLQALHVRFLDAPVTGMEAGAADGTLSIMVGGDPSAFDEVESLLGAMGSLVVHMGASGNGQLMKMTNNVLYDISVAAMAEMLPLAARLGLDPDKVRRIVSSGSGQSFGFDYFAERVLEGRFDEGYPMAGAFKDMIAILDCANEQKAPMPVTSAAMQTYRQALAEGYGDEAKGAMIKVWERVLGIQVRKGE